MVVDGMNVYYLVSVCYWFWVFVNWVWCCCWGIPLSWM